MREFYLEEFVSKYKFVPLIDCVRKINFELVECNKLGTTVDIKLKNGLDLKIIINNINSSNYVDWISFYFYCGKINFEKIDFMLFNDNDNGYNRVIKHDYFLIDGDLVTTFNSGYCFLENDYISGWEKKRRVYSKDIIKYLGNDNLANLSCHVDYEIDNVLDSNDIDNVLKESLLELKSLEKEHVMIKKLSNVL